MKTATIYTEGNLALNVETVSHPGFVVVDGGCLQTGRVAPSMQKSTAKTYAAIIVIATVLFITVLFNIIGTHESKIASLADVPQSSITVKEGDSLWRIASRCDVPGLSTQDVSDAIVSLNHLDKTSLTPGQVLTVPSK